MRVLHLSDDGLPDWRIEKSAITSLNLGYEVFFAGKETDNYKGETFSKIYKVRWTPAARLGIPFYWHSVKKQVEAVLREVRPDIVHAHNIFSAKIISEFGLPFVFDDHEYWMKYPNIFSEMSRLAILEQSKGSTATIKRLQTRVKKAFRGHYAVKLWPKWERELVSSTPTITVSYKIAEGLRKIGNSDRIFVVPNFPLKKEVEDFEKPAPYSQMSSVYAGSDGIAKEKRPNRNIDGLTDMFENHEIGNLTIIGWLGNSTQKVAYKGFLPRQAMFSEMFRHSIGLVPFRKHWSHVYLSPNKAYEYTHAGLLVMCTSSLETIIQTLKGNCVTFDDYNDMALHLEYFREDMEELYKKRLRAFEFARNELIWDKYEKNITQAYRLAN